jgi:protein-S-isoprenylcysteine O-methyltransferase Ste14
VIVSPEVATARLWIVWIISWWVAAFWRDRAVKRPPVRAEIWYRVLVIVGAVLLYTFFIPGASHRTVWTVNTAGRWALVAFVALGLLFTWWARLHLGRLWSSSVTRKADHHIVDSGPYGLVRHPIYSGIILAQLATALESGSPLAMLGVVVMIAGWYVKARTEESFLRSQLEPGAYDAYVARVPMLVPFTARSRYTAHP